MISAIVLAAGNSVRMGKQNKLLLPYGNTTIIGQVVDQLLHSRAGEVVVVLGHEQNKIKAALATQPVKLVFNSRHQTGMTSSIQAGVAAASPRARGYLICLGDMPALTAADYNAIMAGAGAKPEIRVPVFQGQKGNPAFFSKHFKEAILAHKQPEGCRDLVQQHADKVVKVTVAHGRILSDIDTPEDYRSYR